MFRVETVLAAGETTIFEFVLGYQGHGWGFVLE